MISGAGFSRGMPICMFRIPTSWPKSSLGAGSNSHCRFKTTATICGDSKSETWTVIACTLGDRCECPSGFAPMTSERIKDQFLINLCSSNLTKFGKEDFEGQSFPQKVYSSIWTLESQVNNGGF